MVLFASPASDLVSSDNNGAWDVFVRDRNAGTTSRVSLNNSGGEGNSDSDSAEMSPDGRFVAFASAASNLVDGDGNGVRDIFVRDRQAGTTGRVSVASSGTEGTLDAEFPSISADGRYVAFESGSNMLGPGQLPAGPPFVWLRDREAGTTELISVGNGVTCPCTAKQAHAEEARTAVSADGRFVAFTSGGKLTGLSTSADQAYVRDRGAATTNPDADGDGVADAIESSHGVFNDGSGTTGSIKDAAGNTVLVEDANPGGVHITVSGTGAANSLFSVCGFASLALAPGSNVLVTCGSVTVAVTAGTAAISLDGGITTVTIPAGVTGKVSDLGGGKFSVADLGGGSLAITTNGTTATLASGKTTTVAVLTAANLCALTKSYIEGSTKYAALTAKQKQRLDAQIQSACNTAAKITPRLSTKQRAALISAYQTAVAELADQGWLTPSQSGTLEGLAAGL